MSYQTFLQSKKRKRPSSGIEPADIHPQLYPFQAALVRWAVRRGRAAIFADCGLGKTLMQLEWARQIGGPVLIVCPLCVAEQTIEEAQKLDMLVEYVTEPNGADISITNYERLKNFVGTDYRAIVLDESSILKSLDGKTRTMLLREFTQIPHRLCCTATPAPNDISEMANHSEFLGILPRVEMLATFFVHDQDGWRLKGHARKDFWKWLATWSIYMRHPRDIGFEQDGFDLPPVLTKKVLVHTDYREEGMLFPGVSGGIGGRHKARSGTVNERVEQVVRIIDDDPGPWLVWHGLNSEGRILAQLLGDKATLVEGAMSMTQKQDNYHRWRSGEASVLITKPSIFGWGMNWQHCSKMIFLGLGDSYEQYYQATRRCWRFGQKSSVSRYLVVSDAEGDIVSNVQNKEQRANEMAREVIAQMGDIERKEVRGEETERERYREKAEAGDGWRVWLGDSCERMKDIDDHSVGLSIFSPPFASLYTYSASDRDLGNSQSYDQFFEHFRFIIADLLRITKMGRRACVHVQQVSLTKAVHGVIGMRDFRADTVREFVGQGWVYDGEIVIDKDPQAQAIRTKSKALMFVQKNKDSAWSRPAMADYILLFRAPGENGEPIDTDVTNEEWILWARPIWYGIRESDTLNYREARARNDERHIAPLQLETIRRCLRLWSNPGDLVFSPFAGIGSEGFEAIKNGRDFLGIELKPEYYKTAVKNLRAAEAMRAGPLFADVRGVNP